MMIRLAEATDFIRRKSAVAPEVGVILGSGLGDVADAVKADAILPYGEIPHAPASSVVGHSGRLILGRVGSLAVAVMQGRVHYYEGYTMEQVLFLARVLGRLGIRKAIVTNAAGGLNTSFSVGDLMLISDHINFFGVNPLRGPNLDELGVRFPDMTEPYSKKLRGLASRVASEKGITLREGVYMGLSGPTYETPAEVRAYRMLGADAVGMSTIPEVVALAHMGIEVLGISCITNMASGILPQKLTHQEVLDTTASVREHFAGLVLGVLKELGA